VGHADDAEQVRSGPGDAPALLAERVELVGREVGRDQREFGVDDAVAAGGELVSGVVDDHSWN
jgi:hypothetical protein